MQPSKLQLENYFVEEIAFNLQSDQIRNLDEDYKLKSSDLDIEVRLGASQDDKNKKFCQLSVELKKAKTAAYPYKFKIVMAGFFILDESCTEADSDVLLTNTAPSMLYTAAREYLLTATGRTRFFPLMLPTVLFIPKIEEPDSEKKKPSKPKKNPAKLSNKTANK